jgi:sugar lactone lactonase YvrE
MKRSKGLPRALAVVACVAVTSAAAERMVLVAGGTATDGAVQLREPYALDFDRAGNLYIAEMSKGQRIHRLTPGGTLAVVAGTGAKGATGDGGPALQAAFDGMHSLVVAPDGALLAADTWNCRVRRVDLRADVVSTFAGTGEKGFGGDGGPASAARFAGIYSVALDPGGRTLYMADLHNLRVRAMDLKTGIVTTRAGNGQKGVPPDGAAAVSAPLLDPRAVAADGEGNVYILERGGHALRVVDRAGRIRTIVNRSGKKGATGDGGPALDATMNGPKHLCMDRDGGVLIADAENHIVRKYTPAAGRIVRIAGCGRKGTAGVGGPPLDAELNRPHGVCVGPDGSIYIADSYNDRVLRIADSQ